MICLCSPKSALETNGLANLPNEATTAARTLLESSMTAPYRATLLSLALLVCWPLATTAQVTVQVTGIRPAATNVVRVSVTLSNETSRSLNIVDAVDGHPWYHIQPHPDLGLKYGITPSRMANKLKINLAPGATLTDNFWITNPPPRFRIKVPIRDPAAESALLSGTMTNRLARTLTDLNLTRPPDPEFHSTVPAATSAWVDANLP